MRSIAGQTIGSVQDEQETVEFSLLENVEPMIEVMPHSGMRFFRGPRRMEMWKSPKNSDSAHFHRTATTTEYTDISNRYITLTFLPGDNSKCKRKVEMSASRKVEMSKLPFRQMAEAEIGIFDHEWKRVATHRGSG
jgi:hypothetical protein